MKQSGFQLWDLLFSGFAIIFFCFPQQTVTAQELGAMTTAYHSIVLHADGIVWTWGSNSNGQLGDEDPPNPALPNEVLKGEYSGTTYLGDNGNNKIIAVAGGRRHSLALAADGTVFAWGHNVDGKLGDGTTTQRTTPVKVLKGAYSGATYLGDDTNNKIIAIAAGRYMSMAVAEDGRVYSWGGNLNGRLGDGTTTARHTPIQVVKGAYSGTTYLGDNSGNKIIGLACGEGHSLALAADGTVFAWGYGLSGALGDGNTSNSYLPVFVQDGEYSGTSNLGDDSGNKMIAVAAGSGHSAALATDGTVYTWGANSVGQLGNNSTSTSTTPVHVLKGAYFGTTYLGDGASNKITSIRLGLYFSASLTEDGQVYTWGQNGYYNLGDATATDRWTPIIVLKGAYDGTTYLGDDTGNLIQAIALGADFCLALANDNKLYAWGSNASANLGDNTNTNRSTPIIVQNENNDSDFSLPVKLAAFSYSIDHSQILLQWITESETDNLGFILERCTQNEAWVEIASYITHPELAGQGSTIRQSSYSFTDGAVKPGEVYDYRLADISYVGEKEYYSLMLVGVSTEAHIAWDLTLEQNYPNPFNPITTISYDLPEQTTVNLTVFDIRGKEVTTLEQSDKPPGKYEVQLNGLDQSGNPMSTGVYFARLQAGKYNETIKMVYLK
ncbi:MAG: T9SS type A sorting domain-containing protein [Candidatus Marinimicrobia bacterium]|nr:T9SS type A sorting domain-containing protein [Candidatus Neomarinimicrobiota bacterium]